MTLKILNEKKAMAEGNFLVCPYCDSKIHIDPELFSLTVMDDETEIYCENCDNDFVPIREITVSYSTCKNE